MAKKPAKTVKKGSTASKESSPPPLAVEVPTDLNEVRAAIGILVNPALAVATRLAALRALQAATFSALDFETARPEYMAALRQIASDADETLRQRSLGLLARENDKFAQTALLDGLKNPQKALVPPEKALQLLSYDAHAGAFPAAREALQNPPNEDAKYEAVRVLANDPQSAQLLEATLADKKESIDIRRISASALRSLSPEKLQRWAAKAVSDTSEKSELVATGLTALHQFGDSKAITGNKALRASVAKLQTASGAKVKQLAKQLAKKYGL